MRRYIHWECPVCGHHLPILDGLSEDPYCCHTGTIHSRQRPATMIRVDDVVTDADRAELAALVKGHTPQHAAALARAWAEGRGKK